MSEFNCPVCGGHFFGTTFNTPYNMRSPMEKLIGYCKGDIARDSKGRAIFKGGYEGCSFTWPRKDDAKYGLLDSYPKEEEDEGVWTKSNV